MAEWIDNDNDNKDDDDDDHRDSDDESWGRRRLYDCGDCDDTINTLVSDGVPSVCNLSGYGDPIGGWAGMAIEIFCLYFSFVSAEEACEGQCDSGCLAPLSISLEWFDDADLDLYVVEPVGGGKVYFDHRVGVSVEGVFVTLLPPVELHRYLADYVSTSSYGSHGLNVLYPTH